MVRWHVLLVAVAAGCGDPGAGLAPAPDAIADGPVTIVSDPLTITIEGPTGALARERFVEIATVRSVDPTRYYDPRVPAGDDDLTWHVPARAIGVDDEGWLVLDGGARLRLAGGGLELDASAVPEAVLQRLVLPIDPDEPIHGFGESFGGADAHGQVREAQFRVDTSVESGLNEAHVPVPLAMWPRRGIGLFVEDRRYGAFDLGAARPGEVLVTFGLPARGPLPVRVFTGAPLELVEAYVAATARPAVPPRWAFAPQQWRNVHDSSDQVRADAHAMRDLDIPGSVMWIDNPWQTGYNTFVVDGERFVGIDALLAELEGLGYRVVFWSTPYLINSGASQADYQEGRAAGYFVQDATGATLDFPWKEGPVGLVDFTRPEAAAWWQARIARIVERGASGFKLDYGEDVVPELGGNAIEMRLAAGTNQELHGIFNRYYHQTYLDALPEGDGWLITRAGAWGGQDRNPTIWPGDLDSDFSRHGDGNVGGLPAAIAGGLSLSVSGYPFYGSDIGGYREDLPTTEALIRWAQYAALGTIMQLGGGGPSHNPWDETLFDPPALEVYREYAQLHMQLNPYLWTLALAAGERGTPVTRPCRFVFPDAGCDDAMFLLGDALLVAPVIEPGATTREVRLPPGAWVDWWTGERLDGPTTIVADAPLERMPIYQSTAHLVPMFARVADTLEPVTAPGVTTYADRAYGRELKVVVAGGGSLELHDGARAAADGTYAFTPGDEYDIVTWELRRPPATITAVRDGATLLPEVADADALAACAAPGCWRAAGGRLSIRSYATDGASHTITIE